VTCLAASAEAPVDGKPAPAAAETAAAKETAAPAAHAAELPIVVVGSRSVTMAEFESLVREAMRQKYYHGKVPDAQVVELQREVANRIVTNTLLLEEARRRELRPDAEKIQKVVQSYDERYGASEGWKKNREQMLSQVVPELKKRDVLEQLERSVRDVPAPTDKEVADFYAARQELFTEPEKLRLSVILLRVDPGVGQVGWNKAMEEGRSIYKRLKAGADFAELARIHSGDQSADRGGDMGYLHKGMIPPALQAQIDTFKVGEIQEPITTLHGIAIMRVDERVTPKLRPLAEVKDRAADLLRRERGEEAWKAFSEKLRSGATYTIREERFAELAARLQ
jgi:hypothetical protein